MSNPTHLNVPSTSGSFPTGEALPNLSKIPVKELKEFATKSFNDLSNAQGQLQSLTKENTSLKEKADSSHRELTEVKAQLQSLKEENTALKEKANSAHSELTEVRAQLQSLKEGVDSTSLELTEVKGKLNDSTSKLDTHQKESSEAKNLAWKKDMAEKQTAKASEYTAKVIGVTTVIALASKPVIDTARALYNGLPQIRTPSFKNPFSSFSLSPFNTVLEALQKSPQALQKLVENHPEVAGALALAGSAAVVIAHQKITSKGEKPSETSEDTKMKEDAPAKETGNKSSLTLGVAAASVGLAKVSEPEVYKMITAGIAKLPSLKLPSLAATQKSIGAGIEAFHKLAKDNPKAAIAIGSGIAGLVALGVGALALNRSSNGKTSNEVSNNNPDEVSNNNPDEVSNNNPDHNEYKLEELD